MADDVFASTTEATKTILETLVGEGNKFADAEALAKGKQEADSFIEQLQGELKGVREDLAAAEGKEGDSKTVADLIKAVQDSQQQVTGDTNQLSEENLSQTIKDIMEGVSDASTRAQNRETGNTLVLGKVNGDIEAAKTFVAERAKQLGMTTDALAALSEVSPGAFAKLIDIDPSTSTQSITALDGLNTVTIDSATAPTVIDGHKTKAYYDARKKEMGAGDYWKDRRLQDEYYKDATALGSRFNQ
jgi:hypothetical protein